MRLTFIIILLCSSFMSANSISEVPVNDKEKEKKKTKKEKEGNTIDSKSFHSIKKWKITIEYTNGDQISKTITVNEETSISVMEMAFLEAEKYTKTLKNVKGYMVSPVANNSFVLLAGN
ncbi:hypothetical protein [Aquimarina sp. RZ0]|uniref:hypothetical protein n=1 Tax=Aquimarina sp. RZ0 TaxID=2607730 RepID=UPI0011F2C9D2|nr:hypothetical protein [Aquimarina sp. RZ0]KAA1245309.1 hypothetical protein F0000_12360 [Aquimarina sp. RZ0]